MYRTMLKRSLPLEPSDRWSEGEKQGTKDCDVKHSAMSSARHLARTFIALWVACLCLPTYGQIYKYLGLEDGLSSRNVYAVQQSNGGFMWFLTDNGIDRYDGTEMTRFTLVIDGVKFTEYSSSRFIYDQAKDNLWLATSGGKIARYVQRNGNFEVVYSPKIHYRRTDIMRSAVSPIGEDDNIWMFVGEQVFRYNVRTDEGSELTLRCNEDSVTFSAVVSINDSTLYVGTKGGVYRGIIRGETIDIMPIQYLHNVGINVNTFCYSRAYKTLLIGTEDAGIVAYREDTREVIHHRDLLPDVRVTKIIPCGEEDEVLFATNAACVYRMYMDNCYPFPFLSADYNTDYRMNTDNVADICIDQEGQLWMCSFPKGLTVRNEQYPALNWIRRSNLNVNTLTNNGVNYILEDSNHDFWFATDNGVSMYDTQRRRWHTLLSMQDVSPNLNHDFLTMCEVRPGIILLGGYAAGIYVINKETELVDFVKPDLIIPEKYIQTMCLDQTDGSVWAGGENQLFNVSYDGTLRVNYSEIFGGINCITPKDRNHLWIGTKNGLFVFDKSTRMKWRVELPIERFRVNSIFQDSDGTVYIGTHHHGLLVYNEEDNYYCCYNKDNSALTNNCMKSLVGTGNQSLYISSDDGIVRFNKNTGRITTWSNDQGLQGVSFNVQSGIETNRRTLMFGSDMGVIEIPLSASLPHIYKGKLVLSDLYIGNTRTFPDDEDSPLTDALNNMTHLRLNHSQRNAAIKVKCINHIYPSDCQVLWKFDGKRGSKWYPLNEERFITLGELPLGHHRLTIRATSNESGDVLDERQLRITMKPPFYLSFGGLLLEIALLGIILYVVGKYLKSRSQMNISNEKVNFLINTAHDIRTPLTLIKAPLEELSRNDTLGVEEKEAVGLALRNTNTLSQMTDKVMQYELSSIERGVIRVDRHEAIAHFKAQIDKISLLAQAKRQSFCFEHPDEPFDVWVDARKLNSIIQNLLSNAVKYSPNDSTITLRLYRNEHNWGFHVVDCGIGISEKEQRKLFKQFFRGANAINAKIVGSGIGLLSIGRYVKQLHGRIEVKSQVDCGSDFHVSFPLGKSHYKSQITEFIEDAASEIITESAVLPPHYAMEPTDEHRHRLLIVEDNPEMLSYLKRLFDKDFAVYTATNGKEALSKLPYVQPLIVLSDVMMPEMRGDDLCVSIKSNIDTSHIAVVLVSALSDQQSIINGLSVKADAYVTKPFDTKVLQLTIQNLVESRLQLRQQLAALDTSSDDLSDTTSELDLKLISEMKNIIAQNIADNAFTVDVLAYKLCVSRTTLYNKIKGLTGSTPSDFIRICRINKAKILLREHGITIAEVADMVGFADLKYFREVFKKTVGMSPSEYAKGGPAL